MRIISGEKRGLKLDTLEGDNTRPTLDRVKESVFNILQSKYVDWGNVLDLFAGSGNLGLESLSRGANSCTFCDNSKMAIDIVKKNISKCKYEDKSILLECDAYSALNKLFEANKQFDLIFLDPPYSKGTGIAIINQINTKDILTKDGIIVLETNDDEKMSELSESFEIIDDRKYGKIKVYLIKRKG